MVMGFLQSTEVWRFELYRARSLPAWIGIGNFSLVFMVRAEFRIILLYAVGSQRSLPLGCEKKGDSQSHLMQRPHNKMQEKVRVEGKSSISEVRNFDNMKKKVPRLGKRAFWRMAE